MCLMVRVQVCHIICLEVSYSAIDSDFRVNESTVYIKYVAFKQKYTQNKVMYCSISVFPLRAIPIWYLLISSPSSFN